MNEDSQQIRYDAAVILAQDQPLDDHGKLDALKSWLGESTISTQKILGKKVFVYDDNGKKIILLTKCITYLGNPHPVFKKRIQLPLWYEKFCKQIESNRLDYDVRFFGIYHYDGNILFVDFLKDTYLKRKIHNSSAHVYINDLYQGMTYGVFRKEDKNGNTIVVVRGDKLKEYLQGDERSINTLFDLFHKFNCGFTFGQWLYAFDIIKRMHQDNWPQWRQAEWAGWFLEYEFDKFVKENHVEYKMRYVGNSNKGKDAFDFDIRFEEEDFYGDLKASDIKKADAPGNDQSSLVECIYRYKKFWYIIYEHETKKDSESADYEATRARNGYIKSVDPSYDKDELSYHQRMKHSVKFIKMTILELNAVNYSEALKVFNQGHQASGALRAPKFNINKKTLENDNYVVFRYSYK